MRFIKTKLFIGLACFVLGIGVVLLAQKYLLKSKDDLISGSPSLHAMQSMNSLFDQFYNDDFFSSSRDPFDQMRKMRERMMKEFEEPEKGRGLFDSWYKDRFGGGDAGEIKKREDKDFIYYDIAIQGLDKEKLNVKVADGQINITGQIEKKSEEGGSTSFMSSSFHRSFPAPPEVDANKVQMEQSEGRLTLKFPKVEPRG